MGKTMHLIAVIGREDGTCGGSPMECRKVTQETTALWIHYTNLMIETDANSDYIENRTRAARVRERLPAPHGNSGFITA
jgi:hypothetical protein